MRKFASALAVFSLLFLTAQPGVTAEPYGVDRGTPRNTATPDTLPTCATPLGTVAIHEPTRQWWRDYNLGSPEVLLKLYALRSGCLRVVDRNAGLAMRNEERGLSDSGDLQRNSNVGRGQVAAADYFIIPDIANSDQNAGGNAVAGAVGGAIGGGLGGVIGGIRTQRMQAQVLITLVDARTTEQLYVAEGTAQKTNVSLGAGGGYLGATGAALLAGSGYSDTDIGKVISAAYFRAFIDLIHYLQMQQPGTAQANAPIAAQRVTVDVAIVRAQPSGNAPVAYRVNKDGLLYPTGGRNGVWMEVDDENGNRGWVNSTQVTPR